MSSEMEDENYNFNYGVMQYGMSHLWKNHPYTTIEVPMRLPIVRRNGKTTKNTSACRKRVLRKSDTQSIKRL